MILLLFIIALVIAAFFLLPKKKKDSLADFPSSWRAILNDKVLFYHNLTETDKQRFEKDIARFLSRVRITGVETTIDITDKLLVASSAAIPVFGFPEWDYTFLDEVLIYPSSFDRSYGFNNRDEVITGMVGSGTMERKMILSKPALHRGFDNATDKQNVAVHEFIHLLDKEDGTIDGMPATLNGKQFALPWLKLIRDSTKKIMEGEHNDINTYGATNDQEFLAVTGEYFFERPQLLKQNHPELYELLSKAFNQDTAMALKKVDHQKNEIGRNDPCPCGSGKKFKKCCLTS